MKGKKGEQSNREYSFKVLARLTSRNYATYAFVSNELGLVYVDYTAECRNKGGEASPIEDYASGCLHLEAGDENQNWRVAK
jgi:hypothetical protein